MLPTLLQILKRKRSDLSIIKEIELFKQHWTLQKPQLVVVEESKLDIIWIRIIFLDNVRCFGYIGKISLERLYKQALLAKANGTRPVGRSKTGLTNYIKILGRIVWDFTQAKRCM